MPTRNRMSRREKKYDKDNCVHGKWGLFCAECIVDSMINGRGISWTTIDGRKKDVVISNTLHTNSNK